jgi:multicomponent Na+:H+ antiporter subunit A
MLSAILSGFAGSLVAPLLHRTGRREAGWLIALLPLGLAIYFGLFLGPVAAGETQLFAYPWVPQLSLQLSFMLDGLSLLYALLITGIGTLIIIYGGGYLAGHPGLGRFYGLTLMFMASMLGVVLSNNILILFVFWELTSISSYLLIGFNHRQAESRAAALQALLVTGAGGLAMLAGLVLLGMAAGSYELSEIIRSPAVIQASPLYTPALLLVLLGAFTKSAQFPFHFWLPNAMQAPTPVSAYLHSATMVKAGVYLLARLHPALSGTALWEFLVVLVGGLTMLLGAYMALNNTDLKRILAYSTISSLGTLVLLLGLRAEGAVEAAMVYLLAHAMYKGALFMVAGAIDHEAGTRDVSLLGGLRKTMPLLAGVGILAAISLSGLGPVLGFIGKELFFEAVLHTGDSWMIFVPAAVIASAVSIAVAFIVSLRPFFGPEKHTPKHPHDPPVSMWIGPALLGAGGLLMGLFPFIAANYFASPAVSAILQEPHSVYLSLWHGFNQALLLSGISIALGAAAYIGWDNWRRQTSRVERLLRYGPESGYGQFLIWLNRIAQAQTRVLQNGYLRNYILVVIVTFVGLVGSTLIVSHGLAWPQTLMDFYFYEVALAGLIILAAFAAVKSRSRLGAIASMGVVGYSVALYYLLFGAPDLAMTQFLIESLTMVLFVFAFYHLPLFSNLGPRGPRLLHGVIGALSGLVMAGLVLTAVQVELFHPISEYYIENSVELAHGRNIVNVILVDFRGLDTLGEITVLAAAAAGVFSLLKFRRK